MKKIITTLLVSTTMAGCAVKPILAQKCTEKALQQGIAYTGEIEPIQTYLRERKNQISVSEWYYNKGVRTTRSFVCGYSGFTNITYVRQDYESQALSRSHMRAQESLEKSLNPHCELYGDSRIVCY